MRKKEKEKGREERKKKRRIQSWKDLSEVEGGEYGSGYNQNALYLYTKIFKN